MLRKHYVLAFLFLCVTNSVAYASSDFGCGTPRGAILFFSYDNCNSVPFLSPSNDSRLNLELLLIDAGKLAGNLNATLRPDYHPAMKDFVLLRVPFDLDNWQPREPGQSSDTDAGGPKNPSASDAYAQGEGTRCNSFAGGLEAFENAVNATAGLPKEDAAILIEARRGLLLDCGATSDSDLNAPQGLRSAAARDFA